MTQDFKENFEKYLQQQDDLLNNQEKQFDILIQKAEKLHTISLDIKNELKNQEEYIDDLNNKVNEANVGLLRGNSNIKKLLKNESFCCMPCTIL